MGLTRARGPLRAGAAVVPLDLPFSVTVGGYGPPRSSTRESSFPITARATVLDVGGQRFALVLFDTLLVPKPVVEALRRDRAFPVWVAATHTHSGPGNYDRRFAVEWAALGGFDPRVEKALIDAGNAAVEKAQAALVPATLEVSQGEAPLSIARTGLASDHRLLALRFLGSDQKPVAQWLLLAAHPTLVPHRPDAMHPDWPGLLAKDEGVPTFVLQTAVGNASAKEKTPQAEADAVRGAFDQLPKLRFEGDVDFAWSQVRFGLPRPDGSRLVPGWLKPAAENALCDGADHDAELSVLRLGPVALLATPVEPSLVAAQVLEQQSGTTRALAVTNGYLGYAEPEDVADKGEGESNRQYFAPDFLGRLAEAARLAGSGAGTLPVR